MQPLAVLQRRCRRAPYTLPQDYTLFTLLGERTPDIWLRQVDAIVREHGLVQALTHPDPGYLGALPNRERYAEFLTVVAERDELWTPLPREVADWWRVRDSASETGAATGLGTIRIGASVEEVVLEPPPAAKSVAIG